MKSKPVKLIQDNVSAILKVVHKRDVFHDGSRETIVLTHDDTFWKVYPQSYVSESFLCTCAIDTKEKELVEHNYDSYSKAVIRFDMSYAVLLSKKEVLQYLLRS